MIYHGYYNSKRVKNNNQTNNYQKNVNKRIKEISEKRLDIFNYYKSGGVLEFYKGNKFNIINNNSIDSVQGNKNNIISNENLLAFDSRMTKKDYSEKYEKYKIYYDNNNEKVFYTDKTLYNNNKNKIVQNFQTSITGFPNIGNSCYMNSFLQILLHTPYFLQTLIKNLDKCDRFKNDSLVYNLRNLSLNPHNSEYLLKIKQIMGQINQKYQNLTPGDSQIFAIDFIDKLISELNCENSFDSITSTCSNINFSKIDGYIAFQNEKSNDFEKMFQFTEITQGTKLSKYTFSNNLHIELVFPKNINEISLYSLLNNKYLNNKINNVQKKLKVQIADLPEILIISFARGVIGKNVIKTLVSFSNELNLENYIDPELKNYKIIENTTYQLYAINERYGEYKSQGHYVCYIAINNKWYKFSDLYVIPNNPSFKSRDVFGLYYIRNDCIHK